MANFTCPVIPYGVQDEIKALDDPLLTRGHEYCFIRMSFQHVRDEGGLCLAIQFMVEWVIDQDVTWT